MSELRRTYCSTSPIAMKYMTISKSSLAPEVLSKSPLVSVLMTAFNRSQYIAEAIESVLNSSYRNLELIIVDDCSTDNTVEIAEKIATTDVRVKVYQNKKNLGDYLNRNQAAFYAKGKYLKYLDSDDIIYPHGLSVMVDCMELYPNAGFGLSENGFLDKPHPVVFPPKEAYIQNFLKEDLFGRAPGSSIIKTQVFTDSGGFSGLRQVGDYEYWLSLAQTYSIVTMPRDLVWDRTHGQQEKFYDSDIDKEIMWVTVAINALNHLDCPLSTEEKILSMNKLYSGLNRTFWKIILRSFDMKSAMIYKNRLKLSWQRVFGLNFFGGGENYG